eukprot:6214171-Pleurochrysis_carterae.AAC.1
MLRKSTRSSTTRKPRPSCCSSSRLATSSSLQWSARLAPFVWSAKVAPKSQLCTAESSVCCHRIH